MPQIFRKSSNALAKASLIGAGFFGLLLLVGYYAFWRSSYVTSVGISLPQPVLFSHLHHVRGMGLDCRFCHATVESTATAGMPSTETCMTCHSQIYTDSAVLKPVRDSFATNTPLKWTRVHHLPDYVFFNHSMHIQKGVACITCHGRVDQMERTVKTEDMTMSFCLGCHMNPELYVGAKEKVFAMNVEQQQNGEAFVKAHHIDRARLTNCYECHR